MPSIIVLILAALLCFPTTGVSQEIATGSFSPAAVTLATPDLTYLILKRYEPMDEDADEELRSQGQMTYLDLPLGVSNVTLGGNLFTSLVYAIDNSGKVSWEKEIGTTNSSWATGAAIDSKGMLYVGERQGDDGIQIVKLDQEGDEIWTAEIDTLENVHHINALEPNKVVALCSFTHTKRVEKGNQLHFENFFIYHVVTIDKQSGEVLSSTYSTGPAWFGQQGFSVPTLNVPIASYMHKQDSLLYFLHKDGQILNLSRDEFRGMDIQEVVDTRTGFFAISRKGKSSQYQLYAERYDADGKISGTGVIEKNGKHYSITMIPDDQGNVSVMFQDERKMDIHQYDPDLKKGSLER